MAFAQGIYFRATDNQTDPTDYDAETAASVYPWTTAQGNTVGWETSLTGITTRDRDTATNVLLKGIHFVANTGTKDYRIDLPATGSYDIRLAAGDKGFAQFCRVQLLDGDTVFADFETIVDAGHWLDATGVEISGETAWAANNAVKNHTFTTQIFRVRIGAESDGTFNSVITAVHIEDGLPVTTKTVTTTLGAALQKKLTATATLNAKLRKTLLATATLNSVLKGRVALTVSMGALIVELGKTQTLSMDAVIRGFSQSPRDRTAYV